MHLTDAYFFAELQTQLGQSAASGWLRGQLRREFSCSSSNSGTNIILRVIYIEVETLLGLRLEDEETVEKVGVCIKIN